MSLKPILSTFLKCLPLIIFTFPSKGQYERFLHLDELNCDIDVVTYFHDRFSEENLDTTVLMPEIRAIRALAVSENDKNLELKTFITEIRLLVENKKIAPDYIESRLNQVLEIAEKSNRKGFEANLLYYYATFHYYRSKNYELAFRYFDKMHEMTQSLNMSLYPSMLFDLTQVMHYYFDFKENRKTISIAQEIQNFEDKDSIKLWTFKPEAFYMIARAYKKLKNTDSSMIYLEKALTLAIEADDVYKVGMCHTYIGKLHHDEAHYEKSEYHLKKALDFLTKANRDPKEENLTRMYLADTKIRLGKINEAAKLVKYVEAWNPKETYDSHKPIFFELLSRYYITMGDAKKANHYLDLSLKWQKSITEEFDYKKLLRLKQKEVLQTLETDKNNKIFRRNILIAGLLLTMLIFIFLYINRVKRNKANLAAAQRELDIAFADLNSFKNEITRKSLLLDELETKMKLSVESEVLNTLRKTTILTEDEWTEFRKLFEKVHPGFIHKLRKNSPSLTPSEVRYLTLRKLDLNNKEMAAILGISEPSVRSTVSRLRKKITDNKHTSISELIN